MEVAAVAETPGEEDDANAAGCNVFVCTSERDVVAGITAGCKPNMLGSDVVDVATDD
jgi:hypothetical protein